MTFELTARARRSSEQIGIAPNLILTIEGLSEIFGAVDVSKLALYGDQIEYGDPGLVYGGTAPDPNSRPWITFNQTTRSVSQQLLQDKGGSSSVSNFKINMVDLDGQLTELFQPGQTLSDILGAKAKVYLSFEGDAFPGDAIEIFSGVVEGTDAGPSFWNVIISHPEQLKRQDIFVLFSTQLDGAISDSDTTLTLDSTSGFKLPTTNGVADLRTFTVIEDEIIEFSGISGNDLTGCIRGSLNTIAVAHDDNTELQSFYELSGKPIELALSLMLSNPDEAFIESGTALERVYYLSATEILDGAYIFNEVNIQQRLGLSIGDLFSVSGTLNDFTDQPIIGFGSTDDGLSYVQVAPSGGAFQENEPTGTADFKSPYNLLPDGLRMRASEVDVTGHLDINAFFGSTFPDYRIYLKDTLEGKSFIEKEIYFPSSMYSVPRNGRSGCSITAPPLAIAETKTLDENSVTNASQIKVSRTINKNFYNSVVYKIEEDSLTDKKLFGAAFTDTESTSRIGIGNRQLTIESKGLRNNESTLDLLNRNAARYFDRYRFGAELIKNVEVNYKTGFNLEPADVVVFDGTSLNVADSSTGSRTTGQKLYEVVNKKLDVASGKVRVDILDTGFGLDGRFVVIGPASDIDTGSTASVIRLKESYSTLTGQSETLKWEEYEGLQIRVRSQDFTFDETTRFIGISPTIPNAIEVFPSLSVAPSEDYVVEAAAYDQANDKWKLLHGFYTPQLEVVSGASSTVFDVSASDAAKLFVDAIVKVHSEDFTDESPEVQVIDITGTTITVDEDLGFTPAVDDLINLVGFVSDQGLPYRLL